MKDDHYVHYGCWNDTTCSIELLYQKKHIHLHTRIYFYLGGTFATYFELNMSKWSTHSSWHESGVWPSPLSWTASYICRWIHSLGNVPKLKAKRMTQKSQATPQASSVVSSFISCLSLHRVRPINLHIYQNFMMSCSIIEILCQNTIINGLSTIPQILWSHFFLKVIQSNHIVTSGDID